MRILYAKDAGNSDVSNIRKKKSVVYSNAEGLGERMQQKIKEMLIKIKDVLVSVLHSYKRMRQENNIYFNILVGLVFFAIVGTGVCMVANAREAAALRQVEIQKEKEAQEKKKAEEEAKKAEEAAKAERDKSMSLQPGVAVGTMDPQDDEKVVYLTFDDGPSANTQRVLDILDQYDAKATFFITAQQPDYFPMIKKVYDEGHTIGLHSYTHEYDQVYASVDAYFDDLEKIGEVAKEQLGCEDTLLLESDLIFEESVIDLLLEDERDTLVLVDKFENWMDGTCVVVDEEDNILDFIPGKLLKYSEKEQYYKTHY